MPNGYFFVEIEITYPAAFEAYRTSVSDIISAHGGKILVRGGRVGMWRGGFRFEHICSRLFRLAVPHWFDHGSVSTSRSSNRTCRSPASGSRTSPHAFAHATSCPSLFKRTSPKCPYRCESG